MYRKRKTTSLILKSMKKANFKGGNKLALKEITETKMFLDSKQLRNKNCFSPQCVEQNSDLNTRASPCAFRAEAFPTETR